MLTHCNGGLVETYICHPNSQGFSKSRERSVLVQSIEIQSDSGLDTSMLRAEHNIAQVMELDQKQGKSLDCMREYYMGAHRVFIVNDFIGQGYKDLYMLANIKGSFSEYEIGQIAS